MPSNDSDSAPRPSLRQQQRDATRSRILAGAVDAFREKPFLDTTMDDIARAAGAARITVYDHFSSKGEILAALHEQLYAEVTALADELASQPHWSAPLVEAWARGAVARWEATAATFRVLAAVPAASGSDAGRAHARYLEVHEAAARRLADGDRWRSTPGPEARDRSMMALVQLESFLTLWIAGSWPAGADDPIPLLADTLAHILGPALDPSSEGEESDHPTETPKKGTGA